MLGHDNLRRPTGFTLKDGSTLENQATYGYSATDGRIAQISNPQISNQIFTYSYTPNSSLLDQISGPAHTVTNTWEPDRDVLDVKKNRVGSTVVSSYDYAVNSIGQRSTLSQTGTGFASVRSIAWGYDSYGQVSSADSTIAGQDRAYQYDAIGNRQESADTLTLPGLDNYTANALNQYTSMSVGVSPTLNPLYDSDGNATAYPLPVAPASNSALAWDAENRMISSTVGGSTTFYQYDSRSRRIAKTTGTTTALSICDGWNVIAEYALQNSSFILHTSRLWGMDLSGTLQGAGSVGGLLCESQITNAQISNFFPAYDGNGNVSEYLDATSTLAAHYEYDPFGNTVVNTDTTGQFNYRFSTKPLDSESGLYYYGYRYYDPVTGRWPSRDPIGDKSFYDAYISGTSLQEQADAKRDRLKPPYSMIKNDAINASDRLGLDRYITRFDPLVGKMHVNVAVDTWADQNGKWVKSGTMTFGFSASLFAAGYGYEDFYTGGDPRDLRNYNWISLNPVNIPLSSFSGTGLISGFEGMDMDNPITQKSTPCEDKAMLDKILVEKLNPPRYSALSFNCVHWAFRVFTSYWLDGLWQGRCCNPDHTVWKP